VGVRRGDFGSTYLEGQKEIKKTVDQASPYCGFYRTRNVVNIKYMAHFDVMHNILTEFVKSTKKSLTIDQILFSIRFVHKIY
jgi:hypothetical protein